jgi:hypothetical protein
MSKTLTLTTRSRAADEWAPALQALGTGTVERIRTSGALEGRRGLGGRGYASPATFDLLEALDKLGELTATVYSYRTPIAACIGGAWYRLPGRYSVTTSRHQNRLGECMINLGTLEELADLAEIYGVNLSEVSR